ncbi:MAG: OmpA/MotB family protein [Phycisphaerae bacterium]
MNVRPLVLATLAMAALTLGTGCSNKTAAERDSLVKQNKDLQSQLEQERAARAAAESRANAVTESATAAPTTEPAAPSMEATDNTGGVAIGDVKDLGGGIKTGRNEHGENTITVASDILFDSGKAALKPAAKKALDRVAVILKREYPGRELRIEGYTDPNPVRTSGWDDNWDLGAARARSVLLYLQSKGVHNMYIASFGATRAASMGGTVSRKGAKGKTKSSGAASAYAADRRVEIVVVKNGM